MSLACCVGFPRTPGHEIGIKRRQLEGSFACRAALYSSPALLERSKLNSRQRITMSHERSTPTPPASQDYISSSPNTQQFARVHPGLSRDGPPLTSLERWCQGRSDSTFNALAGAAGGFTSGVITCPLDVIKTKLQAQGGFRTQNANPSQGAVVYQGMLGTARVIWREEGLRGMYRGLGPIIMGYLPTWAVWFTVYGKSKEFFTNYSGMSDKVLYSV